MRTIAIINQKGGVGKTTSAINIAGGLTKLGAKVLLIDLDPQSNLTYSLGIQAHELEFAIYEAMKGECDIKEILISSQGIDFIPSNGKLQKFDVEFVDYPNKETVLSKTLRPLSDYDYAIVDCPPSLGDLTLNALVYCNNVYAALQPEYFALKGLSRLLGVIEEISARGLNNTLALSGIIITMFDKRKALHREALAKLSANFDGLVFDSPIRLNVSLAEAQSQGKTIFDYKKNSNGAKDYLSVCKQILQRLPK